MDDTQASNIYVEHGDQTSTQMKRPITRRYRCNVDSRLAEETQVARRTYWCGFNSHILHVLSLAPVIFRTCHGRVVLVRYAFRLALTTTSCLPVSLWHACRSAPTSRHAPRLLAFVLSRVWAGHTKLLRLLIWRRPGTHRRAGGRGRRLPPRLVPLTYYGKGSAVKIRLHLNLFSRQRRRRRRRTSRRLPPYLGPAASPTKDTRT